MNSRDAISALVFPSAARSATCRSCGVRSSFGGGKVRLRICPPVASSSARARSANGTAPQESNSWCGGFASVTAQDWLATLSVNFLAAVHVTRLALPLLTAQGGGSIITISSVNAALPDPLVIDYSAAKAALSNFCKALSKETGPHGVRVNTVSPGPVATDLWLGSGGVAETIAGLAGSTPDAVASAAVADAPTRR